MKLVEINNLYQNWFDGKESTADLRKLDKDQLIYKLENTTNIRELYLTILFILNNFDVEIYKNSLLKYENDLKLIKYLNLNNHQFKIGETNFDENAQKLYNIAFENRV